MLNSDFTVYHRQLEQYNKLTNFAFLGQLIIRVITGEEKTIQDLIGNPPKFKEETDKVELSDEDKKDKYRNIAKKLNLISGGV